MQIEKALINDHLRVSKVSWKFRIPTMYHLEVTYPWNLLFSSKVVYFFNSFDCLILFINKTLRLNDLKTRTAMNAKISLFVICVEVIIYLLRNLHDCTFNYIWPFSGHDELKNIAGRYCLFYYCFFLHCESY